MLNHLLTFAIFFVIGVEIRQGLSHIKDALLPIAAALGGMMIPAVIFTILQPHSQLWAVVMPTDVALALGVLALIGKKAPSSVRLFLMTLAVADDFFSLVVIGIFYTSDLSLSDSIFTLGAAFIGALIPWALQLMKVLNPVITYLVLPVYIKINLLDHLSFDDSDFSLPGAIVAARIVGKVIGITLTVYLLTRHKHMSLPTGMTFHSVVGVGFLCGMGLTVSLVIAEITEKSELVLNQVRNGLFISAIASALLALAWFRVIPGAVFASGELRNNQ